MEESELLVAFFSKEYSEVNHTPHEVQPLIDEFINVFPEDLPFQITTIV